MKEINLIPKDLLFSIKWDAKRILLLLIIPLMVVIAAMVFVQGKTVAVFSSAIEKGKGTLDELTAKQGEMAELIFGLERLSNRENEISSITSIMESYMNGRLLWSKILADIYGRKDSGVWLDKFEVVESVRKTSDERKEKYISARMQGKSLDPQSVARFMECVEDYPLFTRPVLKQEGKSVYGKRTVYLFDIVCEVRR